MWETWEIEMLGETAPDKAGETAEIAETWGRHGGDSPRRQFPPIRLCQN
jgi:hypothetical protein